MFEETYGSPDAGDVCIADDPNAREERSDGLVEVQELQGKKASDEEGEQPGERRQQLADRLVARHARPHAVDAAPQQVREQRDQRRDSDERCSVGAQAAPDDLATGSVHGVVLAFIGRVCP